MENDAFEIFRLSEIGSFYKMPGNCFAFTIRVGCEVYGIGLFSCFFDLADQSCSATYVDVCRLEGQVFYIDTKRAFWKISDVSH